MSTLLIDRYPGARPFADDPNDELLFYGRDEEIDTLFHRACATRLLILFGKSGLGKTSLLQAGVFPKLRERHLLPLPVRLNIQEIPLTIIKSSAVEVCRKLKIDFTPGIGETLWEFFKTAMFWKGEVLLTPVLVFDQFEEIFTLKNAAERAALARELGDLFRGTLPPSVRQKRQSSGTSENNSSSSNSLSEQPPNVRVILSLREDFLGALQELAADIPGIFDDRVRLSSLSNEQAERVICAPAALRQDITPCGKFVTPPFTYADDTLAEILSYLRGKSGVIEPFQLQLVCQNIEEQVAQQLAKGTPLDTITGRELGGRKRLDEIVQNFYRQTIAKLAWRDRGCAKRLCEEGLLNAEGFRLPVQENEILKSYKLSKKALNELVEARLLRKEPRLESYFYELSHDSLAKPILASQTMKLTRKQLKFALKVSVILILIILGVFGFLHYQEQQAQQAAYAYEGDRLLIQGRLPQAQAAYEKYLESVQQKTVIEPNETTRQLSESVALDKLGDVLKARERLDNAQKRYQESLIIRRKLAELDRSNNERLREVSNSHENLANVFLTKMENSNDPLERKKYGEKALEQFQKTKAFREQLVKLDPSNPTWQSDLSWVCGEISSVLFELDHYQEAAKSAQCGVNHSVKQGDSQANKQSLAQAYGDLAWYELFNRKPEKAIDASKNGLALKTEDDPTNNLLVINLAHGYLFSGQYEKAKEIYLINKDKKVWNDKSVKQMVLNNFELFRKHGINHADMEKIEILLD